VFASCSPVRHRNNRRQPDLIGTGLACLCGKPLAGAVRDSPLLPVPLRRPASAGRLFWGLIKPGLSMRRCLTPPAGGLRAPVSRSTALLAFTRKQKGSQRVVSCVLRERCTNIARNYGCATVEPLLRSSEGRFQKRQCADAKDQEPRKGREGADPRVAACAANRGCSSLASRSPHSRSRSSPRSLRNSGARSAHRGRRWAAPEP
jgi:hypothetical protein